MANQTRIRESELILTKKGTVYHLDITPENLAPTIITVGDPDRVKEVTKHFNIIGFKAQHREFITQTGIIGNKMVTVISTGIGPDNIDIVFNELDALANIDFKTRMVKEEHKQLTIIRLGTCGGLQGGIPVDSLVVSTHGIGLDNLMHYYKHTPTESEQNIVNNFVKHAELQNSPIKPYAFEGTRSLARAFKIGFVHGMTATCPGFYGPQGRQLRLDAAVPNLIDSLSTFEHEHYKVANFEMETSAMYGLAKLMGHQSVSISTVVANRVSKTVSHDPARAVENMIVRSLEVIEALP
jgi:uridine phosphorylase